MERDKSSRTEVTIEIVLIVVVALYLAFRHSM